VMTAANHLAPMQTVPIECLRGEPMIAVTPTVGSLHVSAGRRWLTAHLGEEPNIVAEEPMDQVPSALVQSGVAVTLMTADRAALWAGEGLVSRRVLPSPIVEYGVAYLKSNTSIVLLKMLGIVDEIAPRLPDQLLEGTESLWIPQELAKPSGSPGVG